MTTLHIKSRVGADGSLHLDLPAAMANRPVTVTVQADERLSSGAKPGPMSREEYHAWIERIAGSITDPTFKRHPQGEFEQRDPL